MNKELLRALELSAPAGMGMFPLGIAFGILVAQTGLPWWVAPVSSTVVFAGSAELLLIGLISAGTGLISIATTIFFVNFRHIFYSLSFPLANAGGGLKKLYSLYALTDEAYAITTAHSEELWSTRKLLALQAFLEIYWVAGSLLGALVGFYLPTTIKGLDFALCALFITLLLDAIKAQHQVFSVLIAGTCLIPALIFTPSSPIFVAILLFAAFLILRFIATTLSPHPSTLVTSRHKDEP